MHTRLPETSGQKRQFAEENSGAPSHLQGRSYKTLKWLKRLQLFEICTWCNCSRIRVVASISSARWPARLLQTSGEDWVLQETQVGAPQAVRNCFFRGGSKDSMMRKMDDNQQKQHVCMDDVFTQTRLSVQDKETTRRAQANATPFRDVNHTHLQQEQLNLSEIMNEQTVLSGLKCHFYRSRFTGRKMDQDEWSSW